MQRKSAGLIAAREWHVKVSSSDQDDGHCLEGRLNGAHALMQKKRRTVCHNEIGYFPPQNPVAKTLKCLEPDWLKAQGGNPVLI